MFDFVEFGSVCNWSPGFNFVLYDNTLHMSLCNALFTNRTQDLEV